MSQSAQKQEQPQQPAHQNLVVFEGFSGLNTQPSRYGIDDKQCFIMDGFFPAGNNNARVIPDNGPSVFSPSVVRIAYFDFANIGPTPYALIFLSDGGIFAANTATGVSSPIASTGVIQNPGQLTTALTQWGSQYVLIVSQQANGYFIWDGTNFYSAGDVIPGIDGPGPIASSALSGGGSGYAVGDTGHVNGGINDATYIITSVNATGHGTAYAPGDTGTVNTGNGDATYIINTVDGSGGVTGMHITTPGTNYLTALNVGTSTGGAQPGVGTGLTIDITVASPPGPITGFTLSTIGVVTGYAIGAPGTLYSPGTAGTTPGGAQPGVGVGFTLLLTVTSATVPSGVSGNAIETYQSRVWIGNGPTLIWGAPGSVVDFSTSDGGGSLISNDSTLRVRYTELTQSNGYLYLFGDSSISYIAGVQTTGSPPTTSFSLQNVDPEVGTTWPGTVDVLGSNIVFANAWGAHVSFGGRAAKVSSELDGVYNTQPNFGGQTPSAAKAILFGRRIWALLLPVIDQVTLQPINKLFLWDEKRWCSTQQSASLAFVQTQEIDSILTAWGTDGVSMFRLFQTPSSALTRTLQSKLWAPMSYAFAKGENRLWGIVQFYSGGATTIIISIDSENGPSTNVISITPSGLTWTNNTGGTIVWTNNLGNPIVWSNGTGGLVVLPPQACGQQGALIGITVSTTAQDLAILSMATMPVDVQYRG